MAQIRIYGRSDDIVLSTELREERQASRRLRDVSQHVAGFIEAGEATRLANGKVEHCWRLPESDGVDGGAGGCCLLQYIAIGVPIAGVVAPGTQQENRFLLVQSFNPIQTVHYKVQGVIHRALVIVGHRKMA